MIYDALFQPDVIGSVTLELSKQYPSDIRWRRSMPDHPLVRPLRDIVAMSRVCRTWHSAVCATDLAWRPLLAVAFPDLGGWNEDEAPRPRLRYRELYQMMLQIERLRFTPATVPPPHTPGASLEDFTFTLEARFERWSSSPSESALLDLEETGHYQAWSGTLGEANLGDRPDTEAPALGLLEVDSAMCTLSVFAAAPPTTAGQPPRTMKLYEGEYDGGDEDASEMYAYYTTQPIPYEHYGVGANELDEFGKGCVPEAEVGVKFTMAPQVYSGSIALNLMYDDRLYEEQLVQYLRGEPITAFLVDRELASRLEQAAAGEGG
jgi:hypothetical protein